MEDLIFFLVTFVVIFLVYLTNYFIKRKKEILDKSKELDLLIYWFKLKRKELNSERLMLVFTLINSLIISGTATVCTVFDISYVWQIAIGFVMVLSLMYVSYGIIGKTLKKKRGKTNGKYSKNRKKVAR